MRWLAIVVSGMVVAAGCASAEAPAPPTTPPKAEAPNSPASSPMAWTFANTMKMDMPGQGYSAKRFINADGTWTEENSFGSAAGTWTMKDGKVCYTQTRPGPAPGYDGLCYDATPRKPGDSWKNFDPVTLNEIDITIVAGRG